MTPIAKEQVTELLEEFGRLLELKGENPFKIRAYSNAARALEAFPGDLAAAVRDGTLHELPGIGKGIAEKIGELVETGHLEAFDELRDEFPPDILQLFELQGLGAKKIKALHDNLRVSSITGLERACRDGRVAGLAGFGEKTAGNLLAAIESRKKHAGTYLFGSVAGAAETLYNDLRAHPDVIQVAIAGSYRRRKETLHDLDLIVATRNPQAVSDYFVGYEMVETVLAHGSTKSSVRLRLGIQCDLRVVSGAEYPFALVYFTGSKEHNIALRSRALQHGWTLNEYRLGPVEAPKKKPEPIPAIHDEADLYKALGLTYIEPELREDRGEIEAAEKDTLPELIKAENLRGTFHNHTTASDGRSTLEEMIDAAQELGLQYLGIADHSKASFQAHGLDEKRLEAQCKQIADLNKGFDHFRVFTGTECDIHKDGSLDFSDDVLAGLDYVVASVHSSFSLSEADMTARIIKALSNPYVTFLGHLAGRLLLGREPYRVNVPAVIEAAAETGTIIELNANPRRLDMDWRWWPLAKEKGVLCVINPDAHHTSGLEHLWFGVNIARKGWLTRADVINCLPLGKIEKVLEHKRAKAQRRSRS